MKHKILLSLLLLITTIITGCRSRQRAETAYDRPLLPGQSALRKITDPYEIPDFTMACFDLTDMRTAIDRSLNYLSKPSSQQFFPLGDVTHKRAVDSLKAFAEMMDSRLTPRSMNETIRAKFDVYMSVGCDDFGTVLFTGYYTPIFDGSMTRTERFEYPLYKTPKDLVKGPDGETLGQRNPSGVLTQYPPRAIIESTKMLAGTELIWLGDPFEVYIAHVQGSAKIRLPNSKLITVG